MNLVDKKHVAMLQFRQNSRQVGGLGDGRSIGHVNLRANFVGNHVGQRGFAQPRRSVQEHVIDRLSAALGGADGDVQLADQRLLPDVLLETLRPQRVVKLCFFLTLRFGGDNSFSRHKRLYRMRSISRSSASVLSSLVFDWRTRSSKRWAITFDSPSAINAVIASSSKFSRRICAALTGAESLTKSFIFPASSATISSAVRRPMPLSWRSNRVSLDSMAVAIWPTGTVSALSAVFGPIPFTVVNRSKNLRSSARRKPISFGSRFPRAASPSR